MCILQSYSGCFSNYYAAASATALEKQQELEALNSHRPSLTLCLFFVGS